MNKPDIAFIPYRQPDEPPRRAGIAAVELSLDSLTDTEVQMVGHLVAAAEEMNAVFRDQFSPDTAKMIETLQTLEDAAEGETKTDLHNYIVILNMQNAPWSLLPRKNPILNSDRNEIAKLAAKARVEKQFEEIASYLFEAVELNDRANYYPHDMNEEEYAELGDSARMVNNSIVRKDGKLVAIPNEERYKEACQKAIFHLRKARGLTENISFQIYLDAKIEEMLSGTEEARRLADYHWVRHDSPIDIIISTAIEVYLDNWKNAKGAASGNVTIRNQDAEALLSKLIASVPQFEADAPWTHRRSEINPETLPKLKFVDVVCWTGDYVTCPMTTIAQSLPNDEWVGKNIGTVNMVYRNTGKAVHSISGSIISNEFLPADIVSRYGDKLFEAGQLHSALHEIGHTTGKQDPEHQGEPRDYLEAEYSALEEARAELFGMWATDWIRKAGIIDEDTAIASHYSMLLAMITSLKFEPNQAHTQARNMMWHYFLEKGAIETIEEGGKARFGLVLDRVGEVVIEMLKTVADLKAAGDKQGAAKLRENYCRPDDLKKDIEERTKDAPLGRGLIFPELKFENGKYLREFSYPAFEKQRKFCG